MEALGVKEYLPAYLDPSLQDEDLQTGVSFASGGTGYDPVTPKILVCTHLYPCLYSTLLFLWYVFTNICKHVLICMCVYSFGGLMAISL